MHIIWKGQACFQLLTAPKKGELISIVIDPFDESIGLKVPSLSADILLITHHHRDHDNIKAIKGTPFVIDGPGEYEIKNIFVQGIPAFHDNVGGKKRGKITIFTIEIEEMRVCHLGDLGQKELTAEQLNQIGDVDILMIPVGGIYTIDGREAFKIISQIGPKVVIPMHYQIPKLKIKLEKIDKFLKVMGIKSIEAQNKLLVKKKDLPTEEMKVVILKP
ncbi:MBL fold metallo-hydrolase [bacterium]|nr:MBL fold metallo-hydrolase [bacterium]